MILLFLPLFITLSFSLFSSPALPPPSPPTFILMKFFHFGGYQVKKSCPHISFQKAAKSICFLYLSGFHLQPLQTKPPPPPPPPPPSSSSSSSSSASSSSSC
ncbi:hypothetical protein QBC42DRAFT_281096 [Cladorrhinum samala]|uniref:Secreted protein n=1 Tax=Cladorrhinum samala TaxID=585594 RepID=A0AAV9H6Z0_9PEZI|nr:hypothetical protein QBC42DRAFT_281096 [Cladorrhinum samala]